jgi:hypothetical protein
MTKMAELEMTWKESAMETSVRLTIVIAETSTEKLLNASLQDYTRLTCLVQSSDNILHNKT